MTKTLKAIGFVCGLAGLTLGLCGIPYDKLFAVGFGLYLIGDSRA